MSIPSALKTWYLMLDSPEPAILLDSLNKIIQFLDSAPVHLNVVLEAGMVEKILPKTYSSDERILKATVVLLAMLSETETVHKSFMQEKVLRKVVNFLAVSYSSEIQDEAATILSNVSKDFSVSAKVRQLEGLKALLNCIKVSSDPDVLKNSSDAILTLMNDDFNKKELFYLNGLPLIANLLNSTYTEIQKNGLLCLIRIAAYYPATKEIQKGPIFAKLFELVGTEKLDLPQTSLELVAQTLSVGFDLSQTETSKLVNFIQMLEQAPTNDTIIIHVAKIIALLSPRAFEIIIYKEKWMNSILAYFEKSTKDASTFAVLETLLVLRNVGEKSSLSTVTYQQIGKRLWAIINSNDATPEEKEKALKLFSRVANEAKLDKVKFDAESVSLVVSFLKDAVMKTATFEFLGSIPLTEDYLEVLSNLNCHLLAKEEIESLSGTESIIFLLCWLDQDGNDLRRKSIVTALKSVIPQMMSIVSKGMQCSQEAIKGKAIYAAGLLFQSNVLSLNDILGTDLLKHIEKAAISQPPTILWQIVLDQYASIRYALEGQLPATVKISSLFIDVGRTTLEKLLPVPQMQEIELQVTREMMIVDFEKDADLKLLVSESMQKSESKGVFEKVAVLAAMVSERLGGVVAKQPWNGYKSHMFYLKRQLKSNCTPLGLIRVGTFYHRALLFKVLCDANKIVCSLHRGARYPMAWNEVTVYQEDEKMMQSHVVNLMDRPGQMMSKDSQEGQVYLECEEGRF